MKVKIEYAITDFSGDDYDDANKINDVALQLASALYVQLLGGIDVERAKIEKEREAAYWDRFIVFCRTGVEK